MNTLNRRQFLSNASIMGSGCWLIVNGEQVLAREPVPSLTASRSQIQQSLDAL